MLVQDKLYRHGSVVSWTCPGVVLCDETALDSLGELLTCGFISRIMRSCVVMIGYRLSPLGRSSCYFPFTGTVGTISIFGGLGERVSVMNGLKGLTTVTFLFGKTLGNILKCFLRMEVRIKRKIRHLSNLVRRWINVELFEWILCMRL